jgi:hypothetical protein
LLFRRPRPVPCRVLVPIILRKSDAV